MSSRWATALMALVVATPCLGEERPSSGPVTAGDRVRFLPNGRGKWIEARVLEAEGATWLLRAGDQDPVWVDANALLRVEVFQESGPLVKEGFLIGLGAGALFGARFFGEYCGLDYEGTDCPSVDSRLAAAALCGGTFGGVGALIGKWLQPERWDPVRGGKSHLSVVPAADPRGRGFGATLMVRF